MHVHVCAFRNLSDSKCIAHSRRARVNPSANKTASLCTEQELCLRGRSPDKMGQNTRNMTLVACVGG